MLAAKGGTPAPVSSLEAPGGVVPGCIRLETDQTPVVEPVGCGREAGWSLPSGSGASAHDEHFAPDARAGSAVVGSPAGSTTPTTGRVAPHPCWQKGSRYPSQSPGAAHTLGKSPERPVGPALLPSSRRLDRPADTGLGSRRLLADNSSVDPGYETLP